MSFSYIKQEIIKLNCCHISISDHLLQKELTVINTLHSHLEALWRLRNMEKQVRSMCNG